MKKIAFGVLYLLFSIPVYGQSFMDGILINKFDSAILPFASIRSVKTGEVTLSDADGHFRLKVSDHQKIVLLAITAIGAHQEIQFERTFGEVEKVYVEVMPGTLPDYEIIGLSPREVVRKAVLAIPNNYADSSYFSYATYRQYDIVNGAFKNVLEATPVVMFRIVRRKDELQGTEAFAMRKFWCSSFFHWPAAKPGENSLSELMLENPVLHLQNSSLTAGRRDNCTYAFDTANKSPDFYVVRYISPFSSETHGIGNYRDHSRNFVGESSEAGILTIDKGTFAFRKIERTAMRNPGFSYYTTPNFVLPGRKYYEEFLSGKLIADYEKPGGKWQLKNILYEYSNDFFEAQSGMKKYSVTNVFEWTSDSTSRYATDAIVDKFYSKLQLPQQNCDSTFFSLSKTPFYFFSRDSVYSGIK